MNSVLSAALMGAAGGAVGAGLLWLIDKRFKQRPKWLNGLPVFTVALAVGLARANQPSPQQQLLTTLDDLPNVQAIRTHYPEDYATLRTNVMALPASATPDQAKAAVGSLMATVMKRETPKADADNSLALIALTRDEARAIRASDVAGCTAFLNGAASAKVMGLITTDLQARDQQVVSKLLAQAATRPAAPTNSLEPGELQPLIAKALSSMPAQDQDLAAAVVDGGRAPATPDEHRAVCDFNLAIFDAVLAMPPGMAGVTARGPLAAK